MTAIDILLEPDATMIEHATAANAELLKNFPKGYTLGGAHAPHISVLQRYVYTADLDKVFAAASKVFAKDNPIGWKLKAFKYYYIPDKSIGLAGIVIEPTPDLLRLQKELIDASHALYCAHWYRRRLRDHAARPRHRCAAHRIR